jgi:DNA-binding winged helix-turn-helix (wHTH) protein/TolB-like protein
MSAGLREFNGCRFDPDDGRLTSATGEVTVALRPQATRLLLRFLESPGELLSRDLLIDSVWDEGSVVDFESGLAALMRELRQAFDEVDAGPALIETVPRRGYRFHGQPTAPAEAESPRHSPTPGWLRIALLAAFLITAIALGWLGSQRLAAPHDEQATLAILPFETFLPERASEDRLGLLMADTLLARLWTAELAELELIGRATLRPYQGQDDVASLVARDLDVSLILEGTVSRSDELAWQIDARLLQMPQGRVVWSHSLRLEVESGLPAGSAAEGLVESLAEQWPAIVENLRR